MFIALKKNFFDDLRDHVHLLKDFLNDYRKVLGMIKFIFDSFVFFVYQIIVCNCYCRYNILKSTQCFQFRFLISHTLSLTLLAPSLTDTFRAKKMLQFVISKHFGNYYPNKDNVLCLSAQTDSCLLNKIRFSVYFFNKVATSQ